MGIEAVLAKPSRSVFDAMAKDESHIKMLEEIHDSSTRENNNKVF